MRPILDLAGDLASGRVTSRALTEQMLARIEDPAGEGSRTFVSWNRDRALAEADASDTLRRAGIVPSLLAGLPISIKDLFDIAGERTMAASRTREDAKPAEVDSVTVARLRAAGAVIIGRTNLTEFAYSGIGINPNFNTPRNPWDRETGRIPGGSSSGAAVSVSDEMAAGAIGSDTGGSVRVPAALCGVTGFKTTTGRIPLTGVFPLAQSLDSVGPLAPTVTCCALLDAVMRDAPARVPEPFPLEGLRLAVPQTYVMDNLDDHVAAAFEAALSKLSAAGARITETPLAALDDMGALLNHGGVLGAEAWANHRELLTTKGNLVDPRVRVRIERGDNLSAADLLDIRALRADVMARADAESAAFDALIMPTVACVAPSIADIEASEELYAEMNPHILRNTTVGNLLDRCALTLPCHKPGEAPVGFMVMGETGGDDRLVRVGLAVEAGLNG
ncbi:MAG: amidase [Pseudomonadota bacterium]|nr:amidase [Pseudomonadota bacterium]